MPTIPLFKMFGRSPISPLKKHMKVVYHAVQELKPFFEASMLGDWRLAQTVQQRICDLEHEADKLKRNLRLNLPKGLFMPVSRTAILDLIYKQDMLANRAKDVAGLVFGRKMTMPAAIQKDYMEFLQRCIDACKQAHKSIKELDEVLEAGFSGTEMTIISSMVDKLFEIESDTDVLQIQIRGTIFEMEKTLPPIDVIFLYKVLDWTGMIANHAQHVGDALQLLITR